MADFATLKGEGWRLLIPTGLIAKDHQAWGYDGGKIARGWIGDAPVTVIVQTKKLEGGFNDWVRQVGEHWLEREPPARIGVPGAKDAVRLDGIIEFDGLGAKDDRERCTSVLAKIGNRVWSLTIRSRPEDGIEAELEPIVDSFELVVET